MNRILLPVDRSPNSQNAVRRAVAEFMNDASAEIHLINVRPPFSMYIARFLSRKDLANYHRDEGEKAIKPARDLLDRFGVPYACHVEVGDRARVISEAARHLRCDHIVIGAARKDSLTRWIENSTTSQVLELTDVPVEVVVGDAVSPYERYGIPAAIAAALALALLAAAE